MVDLVERILFRVLCHEKDMIVAGDIFFLREYSELVFPDQVVDRRQTCSINSFKDIP